LRSDFTGHSLQGSVRLNENNEYNLGDDDGVLRMALSNDPKLAKLWQKAELAGFTGRSRVS